MKDIEMTRDVASKIYAGKSGEPFFDDLVNHMTSGSCKVLVLSQTDAVKKLRAEIGPADPAAGPEITILMIFFVFLFTLI